MWSSLIALITISILATECNAQCFIQNPLPPGCHYKNEHYELNSTFRTEDCFDCSCSIKGELNCCKAYGEPVDFDKQKCIAVFNEGTCDYSVLEKRDRSKECPVLEMKG